jgi:hypothetical protein
LDRARFHLGALYNLCEPLIDPNAYEMWPEIQAEGLQYRFRVHAAPAIPEDLSAVIGDTVHNLRAALDHAAWGLVIASNGSPTGSTAYPILRGEHQTGRVRLSGLPEGRSFPFLEVISWHQPNARHGAIGDALPVIEDLDNIDKHCELLAAAAVVRQPWYPVPDGGTQATDARYWSIPLIPRNEILRITFDTRPNFDLQPEFLIEVRLSDGPQGADFATRGCVWVTELSVTSLLKHLIFDVDQLLSAIGAAL